VTNSLFNTSMNPRDRRRRANRRRWRPTCLFGECSVRPPRNHITRRSAFRLVTTRRRSSNSIMAEFILARDR